MVLSNHAVRGKSKGTIDVRAGPERAMWKEARYR